MPEGTRAELRAFCPLFQAWAPRDPRALQTLFELREGGALELLQRVTTRADRLYLIVVDSASGRPALGCGPALVTTEALSPGGLELSGLGPDTPWVEASPLWATQIEAR